MGGDGSLWGGKAARYKPFGGYAGAKPVNYIQNRGFTGHDRTQADDALGVVYMNARVYMPSTGKFLTPDTLVPDPFNSQSLNRYSYVHNRPINLIDPSGHCGYDESDELDKKCEQLAAELEDQYGVDIIWDRSNQWAFHDLEVLRLALEDMFVTMGKELFEKNFSGQKLINKRLFADGILENGDVLPITVSAITCQEECISEYEGAILFLWAWFDDLNDSTKRWVVIHEFGHVYDINSNYEHSQTLAGKLNYRNCFLFCPRVPHRISPYDTNDKETFAQAFAVAIYRGSYETLDPEFLPFRTDNGKWTKPVKIGINYVKSTFE